MMGEAEQVEAVRLVHAAILLSAWRMKTDEPRLLWVQSKTVLTEPLGQYGHHTSRIHLMLKADDTR